MTLEHKNVVRCNDEYVCTACGKSWDISDSEPPACEPQFYSGGVLTDKHPDPEMIPAILPGLRQYWDPVRNAEGIDRMHATAVGKTITILVDGSPTGRLEGNMQADLYARALKGVGITRGVTQHKRMLGDNLPRGCLRNTDFSDLEQRALAQAAIGWPTPASPLSAWLVYDAEDPKTALLVYAMTGKSAVAFVNQVLKLHGTLESCRCQMMDGEARGFAPYVDANPNNRKKAKKASRRNVVTLLEWRR